jgi:glycosyltransferase involved in cell wall biosynthesis
MKVRNVILMSGLRLDHPNSFSHQLRLLAKFMEQRDIKVVLADPGFWSQIQCEQSNHLIKIEKLIKKTNAQAVVLLGYPDQFFFLYKIKGAQIPFFLWAQFSSTVDTKALDHVIPVPLTEKTKGFLKKSGVKHIGPIIPHGVDTNLYFPLSVTERRGLKKRYGLKDLFVIGTVGANTARKRIDKIIESFALFLKNKNDAFLLIKTDRIISLDGTDLKAIAKKSDVLHAIRFITDDLAKERMNELYNLMDMYLNLSEWEGFCIPVIEAMACGVPVAYIPIQGPGETVPYKELLIGGSHILREGERVLYIAEPYGVSKVLLKAYENRRLLADLSHRGRTTAENRFDIRIVTRMWEELIVKTEGSTHSS